MANPSGSPVVTVETPIVSPFVSPIPRYPVLDEVVAACQRATRPASAGAGSAGVTGNVLPPGELSASGRGPARCAFVLPMRSTVLSRVKGSALVFLPRPRVYSPSLFAESRMVVSSLTQVPAAGRCFTVVQFRSRSSTRP